MATGHTEDDFFLFVCFFFQTERITKYFRTELTTDQSIVCHLNIITGGCDVHSPKEKNEDVFSKAKGILHVQNPQVPTASQ